MKENSVSIPVEGISPVSAVLSTPGESKGEDAVGVVIAHGAANDRENPLIVAVAHALARAGHTALRFNFPYRDMGKKSPDSQSKLEMTWRSVFNYFKNETGFRGRAVVAAGKSLGGRVASQVIADRSLPADGLVLLGYPLHAPGKKDQLRDSHLYQIDLPMLFFAGTRDALCDLDLLKTVLNRIEAPWELEVVEGGDHSFLMKKSEDISTEAVHLKIAEKCVNWLEKNP